MTIGLNLKTEIQALNNVANADHFPTLSKSGSLRGMECTTAPEIDMKIVQPEVFRKAFEHLTQLRTTTISNQDLDAIRIHFFNREVVELKVLQLLLRVSANLHKFSENETNEIVNSALKIAQKITPITDTDPQHNQLQQLIKVAMPILSKPSMTAKELENLQRKLLARQTALLATCYTKEKKAQWSRIGSHISMHTVAICAVTLGAVALGAILLDHAVCIKNFSPVDSEEVGYFASPTQTFDAPPGTSVLNQACEQLGGYVSELRGRIADWSSIGLAALGNISYWNPFESSILGQPVDPSL